MFCEQQSVTVMQQVVQEYIGYHRRGHAQLCYLLLVFLTGGLFWLATRASPPLALCFLSRCPLCNASFVLVKVTPQTQYTL